MLYSRRRVLLQDEGRESGIQPAASWDRKSFGTERLERVFFFFFRAQMDFIYFPICLGQLYMELPPVQRIAGTSNIVLFVVGRYPHHTLLCLVRSPHKQRGVLNGVAWRRSYGRCGTAYIIRHDTCWYWKLLRKYNDSAIAVRVQSLAWANQGEEEEA